MIVIYIIMVVVSSVRELFSREEVWGSALPYHGETRHHIYVITILYLL